MIDNTRGMQPNFDRDNFGRMIQGLSDLYSWPRSSASFLAEGDSLTYSLKPPLTTPQTWLQRSGITEYPTQLQEITTTYNYEPKIVVYIFTDGAWETFGDGTILRFVSDFWKSPRRYIWPANVGIKAVFEREDRYTEGYLNKLEQSLP